MKGSWAYDSKYDSMIEDAVRTCPELAIVASNARVLALVCRILHTFHPQAEDCVKAWSYRLTDSLASSSASNHYPPLSKVRIHDYLRAVTSLALSKMASINGFGALSAHMKAQLSDAVVREMNLKPHAFAREWSKEAVFTPSDSKKKKKETAAGPLIVMGDDPKTPQLLDSAHKIGLLTLCPSYRARDSFCAVYDTKYTASPAL
eukprot:PhM_4_TR2052/c4_g3_i5/m.9952